MSEKKFANFRWVEMISLGGVALVVKERLALAVAQREIPHLLLKRYS